MQIRLYTEFIAQAICKYAYVRLERYSVYLSHGASGIAIRRLICMPLKDAKLNPMMQNLRIEKAKQAQAEQISQLIFKLAPSFTAHQDEKELAHWFSISISPSAIRSCISDPSINYLVAQLDQIVAGVIAIRDHQHIQHLFVDQAFQRKGIATALWQRAKSDAIAAGNETEFTVRSSELAVPVYQRLGFVCVDGKRVKDGIAYIPMKLQLKQRD